MNVRPADKVFSSDSEAQEYGHHPYCDGWLGYHEPIGVRLDGLWHPACSKGCAINAIGSAGSEATAKSMAAATQHNWGAEEFCQGECHGAWPEDE